MPQDQAGQTLSRLQALRDNIASLEGTKQILEAIDSAIIKFKEYIAKRRETDPPFTKRS
jgi:hypothetical protein